MSIGLPVFNGETYLREAIESALKQDYPALELVIQDNASTDGTAAICADYAARDGRVRYERNPRNLGAAANYNLCFERARGTYFKWAAHDDAMGPGYLRQAVAALEARPEAVLCTTGVTEIDGAGRPLRTYANHFPGIASPDTARRFAAAIHTRHQCEDFFGLFRRAALVGSELHGAYSGSDRVLLAEMALRGPWVSIPDPVFLHREHENRYTRAILLKDAQQAALWQDPSRKAAARKTEFFYVGVYRHYIRLIGKTVRNPLTRAACYAELLRWWFTDEHGIDVLREVVSPYPALHQQARALKHRLIGASSPTRPGSLPELK
ncbi:glycosyltransferase family 2 protein [Paracraurococcus lichenis]|uniref:Glycosyltransferase family 2 protein n=1 Tax=Paracraurococcus lichenis TaxID=3064888 RepID=A0ABT9E0P1_9PROT|nr:glycosyltransferase family 2 protein [Paracraurococcus sp. LOR1-02]MDO9709711.1 glycosyltransferase family 2 protein [Paracraurococcus sp. LOR1-02]